jgi:hypothetical protein
LAEQITNSIAEEATMSRRIALAFVLFCLPGLARAQKAPERLLAEKAQIYFRWDGIEPHRAAFDKTAVGQILKGDTGQCLAGMFNQLKDQVGSLLALQQLLGGVPPEQLEKMQTESAEVAEFLKVIGRQGLLLGLEVRGLEPPSVQATLVFPQAGAKPTSFLATLRMITTLAQSKINEKQMSAGRTLYHVEIGSVYLGWWIEGKDAVLTAGTDQPEAVVKRLETKGPNITGNPLFKKVQEFKDFETGTRGFVDLAAFVELARGRGKDVAKLVDDLGLGGLQNLVFYSGFDGPAERSLIEIRMPGPRKGLLQLASGKSFKLTDLPTMPPDVTGFSASNFDWAILYDTGEKAAENVVRLVAPDQVSKVKEFLQQAEEAIGVSIRKDILGALDPLTLQYNSPGESILSLGQVTLVKVKDAKKLQASLDQAVKALTKIPGADFAQQKKTYRGVELREIQVKAPGIFYTPTYTIHKDWLVFSLFPQPVQGYILRATGEIPAWKPGQKLAETLDKFPGEYVSLSVADPRPTVRLLLSLAPVVASTVNSLTGANLDVSSFPNPHEVTRHLFPNVTITTDDGTTLRLESRASLALPF